MVLRAAAVVLSSIWGAMTVLLLINGVPNSSATLWRLGLLFLLSLVALVAAVYERVGPMYLSAGVAFVPLGYYLLGSPLFWSIGGSILGVLACAIALHISRRDSDPGTALESGDQGRRTPASGSAEVREPDLPVIVE
jgi:predicted membrane protein